MKIGIGLTQFYYYESDDKVANLLNPLACYFPRRGGSTYDADGWPLTIDPAIFSDWLYLPAFHWYVKPGRYRIDAKGSGQVRLEQPDVGVVLVDFHAPTPGAVSVGGEYDFHTPGGTLAIQSTDATDHLRDVRLYRIDVDPSKTFTPEYLADLSQFAAYRMSAWPLLLGRDTITWSDDPKNPETRQWLAAIELVNTTGRDAWIQVPYAANDDYVKGMARLWKANLKPGIKLYIEESNEIWNWFSLFGAGTKWVDDWRKANMPACTLSQAYVYRAAHHFKVFAAEAPDIPLVRVIAFQHVDPQGFKDALAFMGGTAGEITFPSGIDPVPAGGFKFDAVATAPYADAQTHCDFTAIAALMTSGVAGDKEKAYAMVFAAYYATIDDNERASLAYRTLLAGRGLRHIVYECGPGLSFDPTGILPWQAELLTATYDDPRIAKFMTEAYFPYLARYYDLVMYTQHADLPSPGKYWGIKKNLYDVTSPKWLATTDWIANQKGEPMADVLMTDGGFEQVQVGAGQFKYVPTGSPWTFVGNAGISDKGGGFAKANSLPPDGVQVAFIQTNGSMSCAFTTPDAPYQIRFEAAQRATFQAVRQDLEVVVDGVSVGKFAPLSKDFQSFATAPFSGTTHTVVFKGLNTAGGDNTALIDKVSIVPMPAPPPPPTPPVLVSDIASQAYDVSAQAVEVGIKLTELSTLVLTLKTAAKKLADDAKPKP